MKVWQLGEENLNDTESNHVEGIRNAAIGFMPLVMETARLFYGPAPV